MSFVVEIDDHKMKEESNGMIDDWICCLIERIE